VIERTPERLRVLTVARDGPVCGQVRMHHLGHGVNARVGPSRSDHPGSLLQTETSGEGFAQQTDDGVAARLGREAVETPPVVGEVEAPPLGGDG
jgi:hypothetical protein